METLSRLNARVIDYLATRESVLSDVISLAVKPYSRCLRERVAPEYQPRTRDKVVAALGTGVTLAPVWLAGVNLSFSDGSGVSSGGIIALGEVVALLMTSLHLYRKPV